MLAQLKSLLEKYHASGYMCGHDHRQERIDEGKGPVCVLSGSGFECCHPGTNAHKVPEGAIKTAYWLGERPEGAECPNNKAVSLATGKAAFSAFDVSTRCASRSRTSIRTERSSSRRRRSCREPKDQKPGLW